VAAGRRLGRRTGIGPSGAVVVALTLAACGGDDPAPAAPTTAQPVPSYPPDRVAERAEDALAEQIGTRPAVTCTDDLPAEVGAEIRCTLTAGDDPTRYGVTLTVTAVEDDDVRFDVEVDDEPME
jgi:hypothetical protein